jgi:WD40 repeat protein
LYLALKHSFTLSLLQVLAVSSDDGKVRCFNTRNGELICELVGHEDAVQAAVFDPNSQFLVTCGSDNTFKLWS